MALVNGTFFTPASPTQRYNAASWTRVANAPGVLFAVFAGDSSTQDVDGKETFEAGWGLKKHGFVGFFQDLTQLFFDFSAGTPKDIEDFEDLWGSGPARLLSVPGPFALQHGQTLTLSVLDQPPVTVTFLSEHFTNIADARPEEVARVLDDALVGAGATYEGARVVIVTGPTGPVAHLRVIGGTANTVLAFDLDEKQGAAEGSAFLRVIEFDFAIFSGGTYGTEPFEVSWGASVLKNPVFTLQPTDHFGWKPFYTAPTFETVSPEHFYGWIGFEMATFFDSV